MKYIEIEPKFQKKLATLLKKYSLVNNIARTIDQQGGVTLLVGGAVRDLLLALPVKDLDIEVHNIPLNQLETILKGYGPVSKVGKIFGVLRLHGLDVDWSIPRIDAAGRKPKVNIDPFMGFKKALQRRDLTINAMAIDILKATLIDPFGGRQDLEQKKLSAPDTELFIEDPLRFFRVMQFIGRFGMKPDAKLNALCKKMDISTVSRERIETEFEKLLLKSQQPSLGLRWLDSIKRLEEILPELAATKGVKQETTWHPEGDVFEHTMQAVDAAAVLKYANDQEKLIMLYAALCHDLGKATTTKKINGVYRSLGHEQASAKLAKKLLKRITRNKNLIEAVTKLVDHHMAPAQLVKNKAKPSAYKRLANKLAPDATLEMLANLALADKRGRNEKKHEPLTKNFNEITTFLKKAQKARVLDQIEKPVLQGKDLLDVIEPGPQMGKLLKKAYEIQLTKGIKDKEKLKRLLKDW